MAITVVAGEDRYRDRYDTDVMSRRWWSRRRGRCAPCRAPGNFVVVLDRVKFPRDKVCGDFVGPAALVELGALGARDMDGYLASNVARRAALYLDGKEQITHSSFPGSRECQRTVASTREYSLDNWIVDSARQAGASLMIG